MGNHDESFDTPPAHLPDDRFRAAPCLPLNYMAPALPDSGSSTLSSSAAVGSTCSRHRLSSSSARLPSRQSTDPHRDAFPFSFHRPSRDNPSSTSMVPSTAQGKPIPLEDSTAEHCTSALREINSHYTSRHRFAKSSGARSSTYSEPVIVRSYHPPVPGRRLAGSAKAGGFVFGRAEPDSAGPATLVTRGLPFVGKAGSTGNATTLGAMVRVRASKVPAFPAQQEARLPPVEAFSFKSFMANAEAHGSGNDLNADLDRIAEICARSRYSLSNQYEVHYAPHGSGPSFSTTVQHMPDGQGPTLQVVSSDDERNMKKQTRRRHGGRKNSRAIGNLETIMSSSRSSDEENPRKMSAAEIGEEIRGRTSRKEQGPCSTPPSRRSSTKNATCQDEESSSKVPPRRPSISLALIDGSRQGPAAADSCVAKASATHLVGQPALPQASTSQLELRTAPEQTAEAQAQVKAISFIKTAPAPPSDGPCQPTVIGSISSFQGARSRNRLVAALGAWIPWISSARQAGRAEGSLRCLLKTADCSKDKAMSHA